MTARAASHVLLVAPHEYRTNTETAESNAFQRAVGVAEAEQLATEAILQHRALRDLLVENGVRITVARSLRETPDAPFCNNWFSTHPGPSGARLVLYPMLAPSRRVERRPDLVSMLKSSYAAVLDLSDREPHGVYLESTGSLCLDDEGRTAYAAISPRTDRNLTEEWAAAMGYRLAAFTATDAHGQPYYHTNVMMFIGHGLAGICLESIGERAAPGEMTRSEVEASLAAASLEVVPINRAQVLSFCGNCLPLTNDLGERLLVMSSAAYRGFDPGQRAWISRRTRILHTELSAFETLGGGSARCLLGELF